MVSHHSSCCLREKRKNTVTTQDYISVKHMVYNSIVYFVWFHSTSHCTFFLTLNTAPLSLNKVHSKGSSLSVESSSSMRSIILPPSSSSPLAAKVWRGTATSDSSCSSPASGTSGSSSLTFLASESPSPPSLAVLVSAQGERGRLWPLRSDGAPVPGCPELEGASWGTPAVVRKIMGTVGALPEEELGQAAGAETVVEGV